MGQPLTMNPISAFTGAALDPMLADPLERGFCSTAMGEAAAIRVRIGCPITQGAEERHAITAKFGAFKSSMLQDVEAGRAIELDAIVGAAYEIGQRLGMAMPNIAAVLGLARLFGRVHGLHPEGVRHDGAWPLRAVFADLQCLYHLRRRALQQHRWDTGGRAAPG